MTTFKSQALHIIKIKYCNAGGGGNSPSLIPTNIGIFWEFSSINKPPVPKILSLSVFPVDPSPQNSSIEVTLTSSTSEVFFFEHVLYFRAYCVH